MAKKTTPKANADVSEAHGGEPKFPYTTKPGTLRKVLAQIPQRPKPPAFSGALLKSWGFKDSNDASVIRVLKAVDLLGSNNQPTVSYSGFMHRENGPTRLAEGIRAAYQPFFEAVHEPHKEPVDALRNLFNINSGGSAGTINFQIQTFKALCEYADFSAAAPANPKSNSTVSGVHTGDRNRNKQGEANPPVHIDLHIHLPENKTRRDYEYMFEDIAKYIYGREVKSNENQ